ncbi:MAG: HIT domain-containing protein [Parachlamydiales bacterium]|jgi:histidine triad (HIT) family protein
MNKFDLNLPAIKDRLLAESEYAFAFLTNIPIVPGHTLICPKRSVTYSNELVEEELRDIFSLKSMVCKILQQALSAEGFNFAWNEGSVAGQTVPHFHLHVVPRKEGDAGITGYEPRVFLYRPGSRAKSPHEELTSFATELRQYSNNL